jgi:HlyD family secretion protein
MNTSKKLNIIISLLIIGVGIFLGLTGYFNKNRPLPFDFITARRGNLIQEVNITGQVKPVKSLKLAFEKGGKVAKVLVRVGDKVKPGQGLVAFENSEISAQLLQAQANLEAEQASLNRLLKGTRPEEIKLAQIKATSAEVSLKDAEKNLENIKARAQADLQNVYNAALNTAQEAVLTGKIALLTLSEIQYAHFEKQNQQGVQIAEAKAKAVFALLGARNAGYYTAESLSQLSGGAFGVVQEAINNPVYENIDQALVESLTALQKIKIALETVPIIDALSLTEKTSLNTQKTSLGQAIAAISAGRQQVMIQKTINSKNISAAQEKINNAQNALTSARAELALKEAGATPQQIATQKARVKAARAQVQQAEAQLSKTLLRSPIKGTVTETNAKTGEIIAAGKPVISIISQADFEIEAKVPEASIAKIKIGNPAKITLDAYGPDVLFKAKVFAIDPAETIVEGLTTYKVKLKFVSQPKPIKSGMTADISILTASRENIIAIPQRALITSSQGEKIVRILDNAAVREVKVTTGLRGSSGAIEITQGISEGDKVIIFIK